MVSDGRPEQTDKYSRALRREKDYTVTDRRMGTVMRQSIRTDICSHIERNPDGTVKILAVSDSHGRDNGMLKAMAREEPFQLFFHLGDSQKKERELKAMVSCPCYMVAGNCDFDTDLPSSRIVEAAGHRILLTHGHRDLVSMTYEYLLERAQREHCDIVLAGHTHVPVNEYRDGVWLLNPGSITWPRQESREKSYMVIYLRENGTADPWIRYL